MPHLMLVGEQPGDQEDLAGRPFVGPAGKVLDRALESAGIERGAVYITNAVKHFKNEPRGKRRIHKKPDTSEIDACRWWLDHELEIVRPHVVVALGATAARAVMRKTLTINANRGRLIELDDHRSAVITVHPSYLLRLLEDRDKRREFDRLVKDLRFAADAARQGSLVLARDGRGRFRPRSRRLPTRSSQGAAKAKVKFTARLSQ